MREKFFELAVAPEDHYDAFLSRILESGVAFECMGSEISTFKVSPDARVIVHSSEEDLSPLLSDLQALSLSLGVHFEFSLMQRENKDWIEEYKRAIQPVRIDKFYIRPPWHEALDSKSGDFFDVVIEPSLAFGTGHHESSALALELLSGLDLKDVNLLDVGCGSGILGICAAHLGARVSACDVDPLAIDVCEKNFKLNGVELVDLKLGSLDLFDLSEFSVIVLNIQKEVIKMLYNDLIGCRSGAYAILSGILADDEAEILRHFYGFENRQILKKNEWIAFNLIKK